MNDAQDLFKLKRFANVQAKTSSNNIPHTKKNFESTQKVNLGNPIMADNE